MRNGKVAVVAIVETSIIAPDEPVTRLPVPSAKLQFMPAWDGRSCPFA